MAPRYDFCCFFDHVHEVYLPPRHGKDLGTFLVQCPECSAPAKWKPSVQVQPELKPFVHEHLGPEPVKIESREQYREALMKTDSYGPYCEPGSPSARTMADMAGERQAKAREP